MNHTSEDKAKKKMFRKRIPVHGDSKERVNVLLGELVKAQSHKKSRGSKQVKKLESEIRDMLHLSPDSWLPEDKSIEQLITWLKTHHLGMNQQSQVKVQESLSDRALLQKISGGLAFRGVLLTKYIEDQLEEKEFLLEVPQNVEIIRSHDSEDEIINFSSKQQEKDFKKILCILGKSASANTMSISIPSLSHDGSDQQCSYSSTVKYSTVQIAKYSFQKKFMKLSGEAKGDLTEVLKILEAHGPESSAVEEACKRFFSTYGSHVYMGPLCFGGHFWWTCHSSSFKVTEAETVMEIQNKAISITASATFVGMSESEVSLDMIKELYRDKCSKNTLACTYLQPKVIGGPPSATDFTQWKSGLVADSTTWVLTDRGSKTLSVWDIIQENHDKELGALKVPLRDVWEKLTS